MEGVLIERWLPEDASMAIVDEASVAVARQTVRDEAARLALPVEVGAALATVASELAHNHLRHAGGGRLAVRAIERAGVAGLEVIAADTGPGIADPRTALAGRTPHPGGLGIGLAGVVDLSHEVDFDVRLGEGTCIRARKFAAPVPRSREVGVFGRPYPGERTSGDDAGFVRDDAGLFVALADGLGHGVEAREAASLAIDTMLAGAHGALDVLLLACHATLEPTRGAVVAAGRVAPAGDAVAGVVAGNATLRVQHGKAQHLFGGPSAVVGARGHTIRAREHTEPLGALDAVLLHSDGISSSGASSAEQDVFRDRAIVVAQTFVERYARGRDDVLVLVAR